MTLEIPKKLFGSNELLATKLDIPVIRSPVIQRPRLSLMLAAGAGQRVTTIIAPAGYGKTTLLADWINSLNLADRTVWLTLDEFDNTLRQFWAYVVSGFRKVIPELKVDQNFFMMQHDDPYNLAMLNPLFNELIETSREIILVLDNFHAITNIEILKSLSYLIEHQPNNLHLIIVSRSTPPLPLSRLSIQHDLVEVTDRELAFSLPEIKMYLVNVVKVRLDQDLVKDLLTTTEGWITGIQMAMASSKGKNVERALQYKKHYDNTQLVEYISQEVLQQQPEEIQKFLLETSILSELSTPLCDAIRGREDSQSLLETIQQQNLFIIPVDQNRVWYRYHPLFAEALSIILKRKYPEAIPELNQKASAWSYENGYPGKAIDYAISAGELDKATDILDENAMQAIINFDQTGLVQWTSHFPESLFRQHPNLGIYYALANVLTGQVDPVEPILQIVEGALDGNDQKDLPEEEKFVFRWKISVVRLVKELRFEDKCNQDILSQVASYIPSGDAYLYGYMNHNLAGYYHRNLDFAAAEQAYTQGCDFAQDHQIIHGHVFSLCGLAKIRKQQGRLKDAEWEYNRAQKLLQPIPTPNPTALALIRTGLGEIAILHNDLEGAKKYFKEVIEQFDQLEPGIETHDYLTVIIRISQYMLCIKDIQSARNYFMLGIQTWQSNSKPASLILPEMVDVQKQISIHSNEYEIGATGLLNRINFLEKSHKISLVEQVAYAHILIMQGETDQALAVLLPARETANRIGYGELVYEIQILIALAHSKTGHSESALAEVMKVIEACTAEEYCRIFYNHGSIIRDLVAENRRRFFDKMNNLVQVDIANFLEKLVSTSSISAAAQPDQGKRYARNDQEENKNLSTRELEILELLADGKTIKEISSHLMISINTTKTHVKSIYRKFGEHNGKAVIQRAIELGLLGNRGSG